MVWSSHSKEKYRVRLSVSRHRHGWKTDRRIRRPLSPSASPTPRSFIHRAQKISDFSFHSLQRWNHTNSIFGDRKPNPCHCCMLHASSHRSKPKLFQTISYPIRTNERDKFVLASQSKQQYNIMASTIIYSILWLLLLVFIAWPISWFCAWWWVVLISFESLFPVIKSASEFLEKIVSWPRSVGSAMIKGDTQFPAPW